MHRTTYALQFFFILLVTSSARAQAEGAPSLYVEGYAEAISLVPGDTVNLCISTSAPACSVEIARVGQKREVVWSRDNVPGNERAVPADASTHGCRWPVSVKVPIPENWKTGYYDVRFRVRDKGGEFTERNNRTAEGSAFFVVRSAHPGRDAKILLQLTTNTYNAYNNWGGTSLYAYHGRNHVQGRRVSFERPPASQFFNWEQPFVAWAEKNGHALDYAVNNDLEFHPELLAHYKLILSVGHDEYWSAPMRDHLEEFIAKGGNVAFFSGNTCCWQVRNEDNGRALVSWKQSFAADPLYKPEGGPLLSTLWSHHLVKRPENQLTGVGFLYGGYHLSHGQFMEGPGSFTVHRPEHWLLEGTGLKAGDEFGAKDTIAGYECDGCQFTMKDSLPEPTHKDGTPENFVIVATAPARWHPDDCEWYDRWEKGRLGHAVIGTYTKGGTVVTVGTTDWAHGLRGGDAKVERITANVIEKLSK